MTRTHTQKPVWTWQCDFCGRETWFGLTQAALPSKEAMRESGWHIADLFGDMCPECVQGRAAREAFLKEHPA